MSEEEPKPDAVELLGQSAPRSGADMIVSRPQADASDRDPPAAEASSASDVEKPKKKKKKKAEAESEPVVDDPRAREIAVAFDAGNFARVKVLGDELGKSDDPILAAIGRDYVARIAVDPVQIAFLGLCAVAILTIAWIYIPH
jgi:hypothetical protein